MINYKKPYRPYLSSFYSTISQSTSMKNLFSQPYIWALVAIILVGGVLRFYQFEPWLHFELDQSRDAIVIDQGFEGNFFDLPLLGPKAGGTFLRLGPAFYYLQYVSGLVFGADPAGIAFFIPILGTLAILFVYLMLRRAFSRFESLSLSLLFAVSLYAIMYSRFAWNPNLLIFFMPAGLYALLRAVAGDEKYPGRWFLGAVALLTLATQFHFLAFLALPIITVIFLVLKRPRFSLKIWGLAVVTVLFLYLPMILNESKAGFTNTQEFLGAVTEKSSKEEHNILEKGVRDATEYSQAAIVVLTGFEGSAIPAVILTRAEIGTTCRDKCDDGKPYGITGFILMALSLLALVWTRFRGRNQLSQSSKDFYDLTIIWFGVSFLIFLPLSYGVAPRFYLLVTPLFFILLGILVKTATSKLSARNQMISFGAIVTLFVASNLYFINHRFSELERAKSEAVDNAPDRILKEQVRVTLEQQRLVADFFRERQDATGYTIYMYSDPQYRRALKYVMAEKQVQNDVISLSKVYKQGEYYLVLRHRDDYEPSLRKYREVYDIGEFRSFGTLVVIPLIPKADKITAERQESFESEDSSTPAAAPRYTWREFFQSDGKALEEEGSEEGEDTE